MCEANVVPIDGGREAGRYFRPMRRWSLLLPAALPGSTLAQGCAMCKATAEESGFDVNPGIILLIIVPYVLLFLLFRKRIKAFWKEFMMAKG